MPHDQDVSPADDLVFLYHLHGRSQPDLVLRAVGRGGRSPPVPILVVIVRVALCVTSVGFYGGGVTRGRFISVERSE